MKLILKVSGKACLYFFFSLLPSQSIVANPFGRKLWHINLESEKYNQKKKYHVHSNTGLKFYGAAFKY